MKVKLILAVALLAITATAASAYVGQTWILPIERQGDGWITYAGAGYGGADAYGANTIDGVRRAIWKTNGTTMPTSTELYTIKFFRPTAGNSGWHPIESQFKGVDGETYPVEAGIPWVGAYGTNHQYIGCENGTPGAWTATNFGPHAPESADFNAGANGNLMWLKNGSWLYAKWDYGWAIDHAWSAIELTQVTGAAVPEPSSLLALLAGIPALALIRRKR